MDHHTMSAGDGAAPGSTAQTGPETATPEGGFRRSAGGNRSVGAFQRYNRKRDKRPPECLHGFGPNTLRDRQSQHYSHHRPGRNSGPHGCGTNSRRESLKRFWIVVDVPCVTGVAVIGSDCEKVAQGDAIVSGIPLCRPINSRRHYLKALAKKQRSMPEAYGLEVSTVRRDGMREIHPACLRGKWKTAACLHSDVAETPVDGSEVAALKREATAVGVKFFNSGGSVLPGSNPYALILRGYLLSFPDAEQVRRVLRLFGPGPAAADLAGTRRKNT